MIDYTDITVLLDRSGSMISIRDAMQKGFDEFVGAHRATPSTRLSLVEFDEPPAQLMQGQYGGLTVAESRIALNPVYTAMKIGDVPKLYFQPRGNTPLNDALCKTIDNTGTRLRALPVAERPKSVLFVIITDGQENASKTYTRADALQRITHQTDAYQWQFVYLGANQDAIAEAATYGIHAQNAMTYNFTHGAAENAMFAAATKTAAYTRSVAGGQSVSASASLMSFDDDDRKIATTDTPVTK